MARHSSSDRFPGDYGGNGFRDLVESERMLRALAEAEARDLRKVILDVAYRAGGAQLEQALHEQPNALDAWTAADWRGFFEHVQLGSNDGWKNNDAAQLAELRKEVDELKRQLAAARAEAAAAKREAQQAQEKGGSVPNKNKEADSVSLGALQSYAGAPPAATGPVPSPRVTVVAEEFAQPPERHLAPEHQRLADLLESLPKPILIPDGVRDRFSPDGDRAQREMVVLYLVAESGISERLELEHIYNTYAGRSAQNRRLREIIDDLGTKPGTPNHPARQAGLLDTTTYDFRLNDPYHTALPCVLLTERGRAVCKRMGWEPVESDLERLIRLHHGDEQRDHTMCVLIFVMHARARGWIVTVVPEVEGPAEPDVLIERGDERWYVEVERSRNDPPLSKWANLAALNGGEVAFCAVDGETARRLRGQCVGAGLHGKGTDIAWLIVGTSDPEVEPIYDKVTRTTVNRIVNATPLRLDTVSADTPLWITEF